MKRFARALVAASVVVCSTPWAANIEGIARSCNNCHGMNGVSAGGSMPSIAGLSETYLRNVMMEWKTGKRASANMTRLISGYTDTEISGLAEFFAKQPWTPINQKLDPALVARGKELVRSCSGCHGVTGGEPGNEETPKLNGQSAKYLELELRKYKDESFAMPAMMRMMVKPLKDEDLAAIAAYYASQK